MTKLRVRFARRSDSLNDGVLFDLLCGWVLAFFLLLPVIWRLLGTAWNLRPLNPAERRLVGVWTDGRRRISFGPDRRLEAYRPGLYQPGTAPLDDCGTWSCSEQLLLFIELEGDWGKGGFGLFSGRENSRADELRGVPVALVAEDEFQVSGRAHRRVTSAELRIR